MARQLFLMDLSSVEHVGLSPIYQSVLWAWTVLTAQGRDITLSRWVGQEPLLYNPALSVVTLQSQSLRAAFNQAGTTKLQRSVIPDSWRFVEGIASLTKIHASM